MVHILKENGVKSMSATNKDTVVVIGAHPDDILYIGGSVAKYANAGHLVHSLSITLGETVPGTKFEQEKLKLLRKQEGIEIAEILGAKFTHLDIPCNKIIPTMEMKMELVNIIRKLQGNILLFPTPWDVHADHRNLSVTMKDVVYYVGHAGVKADYPAVDLKAAMMFDIEFYQNEIHEPDILIDISESVDVKFKACMSRNREKWCGKGSGKNIVENLETYIRFWGLRHGVTYAEPLFDTAGSMGMTNNTKKMKVFHYHPIISKI